MERRKKQTTAWVVSSVEDHVTSGGPNCRSTEINTDQNSTAKNTTFRRHITDLLGGVRAKPLFRDSTTIPA